MFGHSLHIPNIIYKITIDKQQSKETFWYTNDGCCVDPSWAYNERGTLVVKDSHVNNIYFSEHKVIFFVDYLQLRQSYSYTSIKCIDAFVKFIVF